MADSCVCLQPEKQQAHSHTEHNKPGSARHGFHMDGTKMQGEQKGWAVRSMSGSGTTCFITPQNQDETLNMEDGCIHH